MLHFMLFWLVIMGMGRNEDWPSACKDFIMTYDKGNLPRYVLEGSCVTFICEVALDKPAVIKTSNKDFFVKEWQLQRDEIRMSYKYNSNNTAYSTVHKLTILNVTQNDSKLWSCICSGTEKWAKLEVIYRPSEREPFCTTQNRLPHYLLNDSLNLQCSSNKGNPEVSLSLNVPEELAAFNTSNVTDIRTNRKEITFNTVLDKASNGSHLNCSVFQEYPSDITLQPFHRSCIWGPIKLFENLNISLRLLNESLSIGSSCSFTCSSNIPDSLITWNASHPYFKQLDSEPGKSTITVEILNDEINYLIISCEATYRDKRVKTSDIFKIHMGKINFINFLVKILLFVGSFSIVILFVLAVSTFIVKRRKDIYRTKNDPVAPTYFTAVKPYGHHDALQKGELISRRFSTATKDSEHPPTAPRRLSVASDSTSIKPGCQTPGAPYRKDVSLDGTDPLYSEYNFIGGESPSRMTVCNAPRRPLACDSIVDLEHDGALSQYFVTSTTDSAVSVLEYDCIPADSRPSKSLTASLRRSIQRTRNSLKIKQEAVSCEKSLDDFLVISNLNSNEKEYDCIPPVIPQRRSLSRTPELSFKRNHSPTRRDGNKEIVILGKQPTFLEGRSEEVYDCIPVEDIVEKNVSVSPEKFSWETNCTYSECESQFDAKQITSSGCTVQESIEYDCIPAI